MICFSVALLLVATLAPPRTVEGIDAGADDSIPP